jgi:hypothetical protein
MIGTDNKTAQDSCGSTTLLEWLGHPMWEFIEPWLPRNRWPQENRTHS